MKILNDLPDLVKADVIDAETAGRIRQYYDTRRGASSNRLLIVFGILGALLVGLGIILIIAHNWDDFSRPVKTIFAFVPLVVGQVACAWVLAKRRESMAWREGSSVFLFFAVASSISLVSQIYNIPGELGAFLLTWMVLCVPLIYVMQSSATSLLCIAGITWYVCETAYWSYPFEDTYAYWPVFMACLPHYYFLVRDRPSSNFTLFHNWFIPLSLVITLMMFEHSSEEFLLVAYMSLFGFLYLIGHLEVFPSQRLRNNGFKAVGSFGTVVLLLVLSFDELWEDLRRESIVLVEEMASIEFAVAGVMTVLAGVLFVRHWTRMGTSGMRPAAPVFLVFVAIFFVGYISPMAVVMVNLLVFIIAVLTIREGARLDHLGVLNYGLMIIAVLVTCRFFDTDLTFITRGILFITVGAGFFVANYRMLQKRKTHA